MAKKTVTSTTKPFVASMEQTLDRPRTSATSAGPTRQQIAVRAYEIYQDRCRTHKCGNPASDWAAAEAELRGQVRR